MTIVAHGRPPQYHNCGFAVIHFATSTMSTILYECSNIRNWSVKYTSCWGNHTTIYKGCSLFKILYNYKSINNRVQQKFETSYPININPNPKPKPNISPRAHAFLSSVNNNNNVFHSRNIVNEIHSKSHIHY